MSYSLSTRLRIEKDVVVRLNKILKGKGRINVSVGQEVIPSDIIGSASVSVGFRTINLAERLGVAPAEAEKYLKRSLGQRIFKGELLASRKASLFGGQKMVVSPTDGVLEFINPKTGELKMTFIPKKVDLPAGVYGIVESVDSEKGLVIIRTQASIIHGMFGSGRLRDGILHILGRRDELLGASLISQKYDEQILVGGALVFKDTLSVAISAGVSGIITGGINAKDYKSMAGDRLIFPKRLENDIGIAVVVCEGFGSIPIGEDIYRFLSRYDGRYVSIDGNSAQITLPSFESNSINKVRKSALPPLQDTNLTTEDHQKQFVNLQVGLQVRVIGNSYAGWQGKVVAIDKTETVLPSKIRTILATIETKTRKIKVPVVNLEVLSYSL